MSYTFAPGCALVLYKRTLVDRLLEYLRARYGDVDLSLTCCRHTPQAVVGTCVINVCPGCDRRYRENYATPSTVSLWEILADSADFAFPDYGGRQMAVLDACPTRDQARIHDAVRKLAERMNIVVVEPQKTRERSTCCGDTFHGEIPTDKVLLQMRAKAESMPVDDVIVYCVSCSKSMFNGGISPRYMVDLLFNEDTVPGTCDPDAWHGELDRFMAAHSERGPGTTTRPGFSGTSRLWGCRLTMSGRSCRRHTWSLSRQLQDWFERRWRFWAPGGIRSHPCGPGSRCQSAVLARQPACDRFR